MNEYEKQAEQFLADTETTLNIQYLRTGPYFHDDEESRDIYQFTLSNARGSYSAQFGDSLQSTMDRARYKAHKLPTAYDILSVIGDYVEPTFVDWCDYFGYSDAPMQDYPKIRAIHDACLAESAALARMFTPEQLEQLREIN